MVGTNSAHPAGDAERVWLTVEQAATLWDIEPGYLNTSSYGPPPRPAWDALQRSLDDWRAGRTSWEPWADAVSVSRDRFAALIGVDPAAVTTGAAVSQLLAPVAAAVPDGCRVLVADVEFTSNVFPWAVHADRGVTVRTAPAGRLAEAVAHYEEVLRLQPNNAEAHYNFAVALAQMPGRMPDAIAHFEGVVRLKPDFVEARCSLAMAYAETGQ